MSLLSAIKTTTSKVVTAVKNELSAKPPAGTTVYSSVISPAAVTKVAASVVKTATPIATKAAEVVKSAVSSLVKTAAEKPIATAIVGTGAIIVAKSSKSKEALSDLPSEYNKFTSNVADAIDNPSYESAAKIFSDSPIISSAAVVGTAIAGGALVKGAVTTGATIANTLAVKQQTAVYKDAPGQLYSMVDKTATSSVLIPDKNFPTESKTTITTDKGVPLTPELIDIKSVKTNGVTKRKRSIKKPFMFNQSIKIYNQSKHLNNRYVSC